MVPNDDNRLADGLELRTEFINDQGSDGVDSTWLNLGCSMLEMLVALSRRAAFETGMRPDEWFWLMLKNIGMDRFSDSKYNPTIAEIVDDALERVIYRTYNHTGRGGLFPLKQTTNDQRKVEIWYQLSEYLMEEDLV